MISKIEATSKTSPGLHLISDTRNQYFYHADQHGRQHNSRSGFAVYYRYKPRNIAHLCNDTFTGVSIDKPKIHEAVMNRIKENTRSYAPTGLPAEYEVVSTRGTPIDYETSSEKSQRHRALNAAIDVIFWRRWLYAALLITTFVFLAARFYLPWQPGDICKDSACAFDPLLQFIIKSLPDFAAGWFEVLRQYPNLLWALILAFTLFVILKRYALDRTQTKASAAWCALKQCGPIPQWTPRIISRARNIIHTKFRSLVRWSMAVGVFILICYLLITAVSHTSLHLRNTLGWMCKESGARPLKERQTVTFPISNACFSSGILLQKGQSYHFNIQHDTWSDGTTYEGDPDGLFSPSLLHTFGVPLRRHITKPWLKLMGRVGSSGNDEISIGSKLDEYQARSTGELFLYVNDATFGFLPNWAIPYTWSFGPNNGNAIITASLIKDKEIQENINN